MQTNIKSIAIEKGDKAFLPEAYAYRDYFRKNGFVCEFVNKNSKEALNFDAIILFHGFHPFWKKYPKFVISEYNSLSTGKLNRLKDLAKRLLNVRGDLYIFLNEDVRKHMFFNPKINYIVRSMGHSSDLDHISSHEKKFDVIYSGSYRPGLNHQIDNLANLGLKVAVVGFDYKHNNSNIISFGRVDPSKVISLLAQSRYGLNYTPNIFPLNIQDSTKVIEYCAAGLGVITNRYKWINDFEKSTQSKFLSIDDIQTIEDVTNFDFKSAAISNLTWSSILETSKILIKIKEISSN